MTNVTNILEFSTFDVGDSCGILALASSQHDPIKIFVQKMVDSVTKVPQMSPTFFIATIRHRHRRIQINPNDLISVSTRQFVNIP